MKLAVSNIAWENDQLKEHLSLIKNLGCDGLELAPNALWPEPIDVLKIELDEFKKFINSFGLIIPAFHALLYTHPEMNLFGDISQRNKLRTYLEKLIDIASYLDAGALIYGSTTSRRVGDKDYAECYDKAVDTFKAVGEYAQNKNTCLCIEPLGASESDFITSAAQGMKLVEDVNVGGFGLHLDTKALVEAGDDYDKIFTDYGSRIKHFHVSNPSLEPPQSESIDHASIGRALSRSRYEGFVSIEMRRGFGDSKIVVREAVEYVRRAYRL